MTKEPLFLNKFNNALDTALPTVEKVEALGNKAVKVTFSEPIDKTTVQIGDFKLDDKAIAGSVESEDGRSVIVKTYTKLADGEHTIAVSGVKDFAEYTIVSTSQ